MIKPANCPICGSEAFSYGLYVGCLGKSCALYGPTCSPENQAIVAWNRIALAVKSHGDLVEMLVQARACIEYCQANHKDAQAGTGLPIKNAIGKVLAAARGEKQ